MDQIRSTDSGDRAVNASLHGHTSCTPAPADQLFEITVLDTAHEDDPARWHTIGWGIDRRDADAIAEAYVNRSLSPYDAAQIRHNGRLIREHRRRTG
jgi:hypothetical protein